MGQPLTAAVRFLSGEREPVRVATTSNITLQALQVIDDVELEVGDRVLVKDQTDQKQNGIYLASEGRWFRAPDASYTRAINEGVTVAVQEGTAGNGKTFKFTSSNPVVGTDPITITYFLSDTIAQDIADVALAAIAPVQAAAEAARDEALAAAAGVNLPILGSPNALMNLTANPSGSGYDLFLEKVLAVSFDVVADGVTDCSTLLQDAIDATPSGFRLILPPGVILATGLNGKSNVEIVGSRGTILRRPANSAGNSSILTFSAVSGFSVKNISFDGNKANQTNAAHNLTISACTGYVVEGCSSYSAKAVSGGFGSGIVVVNQAGSTTRATLKNNVCYSNDQTGIYANKSAGVDVVGNVCSNNGGGGIWWADFDATPTKFSCDSCSFVRNTCNGNTGVGLSLGTLKASTNGSGQPIYGKTSMCLTSAVVAGNRCFNNTIYGIAVYGERCVINDNVCGSNIGASFAADYNFCCVGSVVSGNTSLNASVYGMDCGGCESTTFSGNTITSVGDGSPEPSCVGINLGATINCFCEGNTIILTKVGQGISLSGIDGDGVTPFPWVGNRTRVSNNRITLPGGAATGIFVYNNYLHACVEGNIVHGATTFNEAYQFQTPLVHDGNKIEIGGSYAPNVASATTMVIPDAGRSLYVTGSTTISNIRTYSENIFVGKVRAVLMSSFGSGYTSKPTVSFSGGGGSGAAGTAELDNGGRIIGVTMTSHGSGYTSAPTVSFSGGGGAGAAGAALVGLGNGPQREISILFGAAITVNSGGNLLLKGNTLAADGTTVLTMRSDFGSWYEVSRGRAS